jgi:hypothetical protein
MTAFESLLGDNEMAAVLTYVGNSWGYVILTGVGETAFCHAGADVAKPGPGFTWASAIRRSPLLVPG